ncbi:MULTISPECIES: hypothetical protein [unclassified Microcella]|uniref:hypothetical protein n=1 Tax=unclassified Microcella TaxID=2630066 RepID=UPI0006FF8C80|nr:MULTISPECIES: hypothetical protein [unclassified Microcella]KQV25617.1 hypothetical protein ASC54_01020 [Yonghaparkia sp. Root332]KRF33574.1 hypothetical protein ASG83_06610 [Yonghaparkia sp. Soil809]
MRYFRWIATGLLAVALVINAVIHLRLAAPFDAIAGTIVTQGDLFRIQAAANLVAVAVVVIARHRWADALALVIAAGGAALIIVTALVPLDLTAIGLPLLFEPAFYPDKTTALVAQLVAALAATALLALRRRPTS